MAFADTQKLTVELDLKGNLTSGLSKAARALQGFDRATSNTQRSLSKFGRNIERGIVLGIAATGTALLGVVKAASDYESAFAGVRKTVTATEPELKQLSDQFRALSKEIPISAAELARLGEAGGALGVPTKQLKEFVRVTALLGVTTNLTADEAADALGVLGNVLHLTGDEYSKFASSLVALGNAGASTEKDIVSIAQRAGAAGALIGVSTEQILGFSSAVASLGIEAEAGGTAIQKFFIDSAKAVAGGGKDLKEFAKVAGVSSKSFAASFKKDAGGALQDFLEGLGKLPQAAQLKVLDDLGFTDQRITRTLLGLANNTKLVSDQMGVANTAFKANTALTKEAEQRFNTFDSQLTITKNTLTDMAITIGSKLLPKITPLLKRLNEFVGAHQADIEKFGDSLASGFEKFAAALQKVDWQPFIDGLKLSASIAKSAIDLFMSLPNEIKAAAIGAFAVNKLTGGLPTSIIKDAGGALLQQLAGRGSSPANPMWVANVGAPGGPGGPGGGGGVPTVLKLLLIPLVAELADFIHEQIKAPPDIPASQLSWPWGPKNTPKIDFGPFTNIFGGSPEGGGTPAAGAAGSVGTTALLGPAIKGIRAALGITPGKQRDDLVDLVQLQKSANAFLNDIYQTAVRGLKTAKSPAEIQKAVAAALAVVTKRGNATATGKVLVDLKNQLVHTTDPQTRRILKDAIAKVEHKLAGRALVQKQLDKADQIFKSSKSADQKLHDLKIIEKSLEHTSRSGQAKIRDKMEQVRKAAKYAGQQAAAAIKDKDLSFKVTVPVSVTATVTNRESSHAQATFRRAFNYIS